MLLLQSVMAVLKNQHLTNLKFTQEYVNIIIIGLGQICFNLHTRRFLYIGFIYVITIFFCRLLITFANSLDPDQD